MKRRLRSSSKPQELERLPLNSVLASLAFYDQYDLSLITAKITEIENERKDIFIRCIPSEIWKKIIYHAFIQDILIEMKKLGKLGDEKYVFTKELYFQKLSLLTTNKMFSLHTHQLIIEYLFPRKTDSNHLLVHFTHETELDLEKNHVINAATVSKFKRLDKLNISDNKNITEDVVLQFASSLQTLELFSNIKIKDRALCRMTNLKRLDISANNLITETALSALHKNLIHLSMRNNRQITIAVLTTLTNLVSIDMAYTPLVTDENLSCLPNIKYLGLACNTRITGEGLKHLPNLTSISLFQNNLIFGDKFSQLQRDLLTELSLGSNSVISNNFVASLTNLVKLNIAGNKLITGESLQFLTQLTYLNLSDNTIIEDEDIFKLPNLTSLFLIRNDKISDASLSTLVNLTTLSLWGNTRITDQGLRTLFQLKIIDIGDNKLISKKGLSYCRDTLSEIFMFNNDRIHDEDLLSLPKLNKIIPNRYYNPFWFNI